MPIPVKDEQEFYKQDELGFYGNDDIIRFIVPASYSYGKGQDILLKGISMLPHEMMEKSEFIFCGFVLDGDEEYYESLKRVADELPNVAIEGSQTREQLYRRYASSDCVVIPTRMDLGPLTAIEAAMFGKIVVISDAAGLSENFEDCVSGFVFPSENVEELLKRIMLIISDFPKLAAIGENARHVYETSFSPDTARAALVKLIGESRSTVMV